MKEPAGRPALRACSAANPCLARRTPRRQHAAPRRRVAAPSHC